MGRGSRGLVSVIMGVYNGENRLTKAVESILNQTYKNFEFIICDDGSTDKSYSVLEEISRKDDRIIVIKNDKNMGLAPTLNNCLKLAKGEFIARMDDDDYSYPERFEKQIEFLSSNKSCDYVGCNVGIRQNGRLTGVRKMPQTPSIKDFLYNMPFIHPTLIFRKNALLKMNGYSEADYCERCEDYDLLLRMFSKKIYGANMQEVLFDYEVRISHVKLKYRVNEMNVRFRRFKELKHFPKAFPYAMKPLIAWITPTGLLNRYKNKRFYSEKN